MTELKIPVGISDFTQIRENGYYYIDKSGMIREILQTESTAVTLITRPRRFGKTLGMSMMSSFFDIRKNSHFLFQGMEISTDTELCSKWMNQYPTLFVSWKDVDGLNFQSAFEMLSAVIADLYKEHRYVMECGRISDADKEIIRKLIWGEASVTEIKRSLAMLIDAMREYYEKPVILLLDEYDVPVAKASSHGYYAEMLDVIKALMGTALKDNPSLKFAVLTGCLKIAKESIFTGTNNFVSDTISGSRLNEYFGFTDQDVKKLLTDAGMLAQSENIKRWYDGYHFGKVDVYCPWDVMNYLRDIQNDPEAVPKSYWKNTSDNAIIRSFIDYAGSSITEKMETLLAGNYIVQRVEENLTYDYLHASEENLWSVLYLTGYLTMADRNRIKEEIPEGMVALMIPNLEIREIFETTVQNWFLEQAREWNRSRLFEAVWKQEPEILTKEMNTLLRMTISYHDYREDFYHAFLAGIFAGAGYMVESNKEHGEGRSDVIVKDPRNGRVAVFEAKHSKSLEHMEKDCMQALNQIDEKMYAKEFEDAYDQVNCYGIAFYKKRCLVREK